MMNFVKSRFYKLISHYYYYGMRNGEMICTYKSKLCRCVGVLLCRKTMIIESK